MNRTEQEKVLQKL